MDELTLRRAREGDSAAFEALTAPSEQLLWRVCWQYTRNEADAADCLQETMLKAWRALPQWRGGCAVGSWLYRVCVSCCLDFLKKKARHGGGRTDSLDALAEAGHDPADPARGPAEAAEAAEHRRAVYAAIADLPDDQREALVLTALEGVPIEEAAVRLGVPAGTVKSRVSRARQKLRENLSLWREAAEPDGKNVVRSDERRARS